ncbi:MAG: PEP-CTERM sorting domain-containing protein [candidate division Zixibacteria bacterium]|nr:PEP-CTERM sorting domain-containing protein [candidate division Zixibacteria bacterium]MBU1471318.1 PEP-CTERM sorting domain-containing protein [candidate division Zixibacteria bacterium]MBU2625809.1 PEP-CTERM sorting domain-containing protein [candidate division Zixibacteria bacterium]
MIMIKFAVILIIAVSLVFGSSAYALIVDFEMGLARNVENASSGVPGLQFISSADDDWLHPDIPTSDCIGDAFDLLDGQENGTSDVPYSKQGGSDFLSLSPAVNSTSNTLPNNHGSMNSFDDIIGEPSGDPSDLPEPATLLLLGAGLLGGGIARRKARK